MDRYQWTALRQGLDGGPLPCQLRSQGSRNLHAISDEERPLEERGCRALTLTCGEMALCHDQVTDDRLLLRRWQIGEVIAFDVFRGS